MLEPESRMWRKSVVRIFTPLPDSLYLYILAGEEKQKPPRWRLLHEGLGSFLLFLLLLALDAEHQAQNRNEDVPRLYEHQLNGSQEKPSGYGASSFCSLRTARHNGKPNCHDADCQIKLEQ